MSSTTNGVEILLATLESSRDTQTSINVSLCLLDLAGTPKRTTSLVSRGAIQILLSALSAASKYQDANNQLLLILHQVLAKVGPKDRKFGVKARLSGAIAITVGMLKVDDSNIKVSLPVLQVLRVYAINSVNASNMGKLGVLSYLLRIVTSCGFKNNRVLKISLETLCLLVKSKSNAARALGHGGMITMLTLLNTWHQFDARNKQLVIRKSILNVIKNITELRSGRRAFNDADGTKLLYGIGKQMMDKPGKDVDALVGVISGILRKCSKRHRLPVKTLTSCFQFDLPDEALAKEILAQNGGYDVFDESDDQDDDDTESSDEQQTEASASAEAEESLSIKRYPRTAEDLAMYDNFFPEMTDYDEEMQDLNGDFEDAIHRKKSFSTIRIPTAEVDSPPKSSLASPTEPSLSLPELKLCAPLTGGSHPISPRMQNLVLNVSGMQLGTSMEASGSSEQVPLVGMQTRRTKRTVATGSPNQSPKHSRSQPQLREVKSPHKHVKMSKSATSVRNVLSRNGSSSSGSPKKKKTKKIKSNSSSLDSNGDLLGSSLRISQIPVEMRTPDVKENESIFLALRGVNLEDVGPEEYGEWMTETKRVQTFQSIAHPEMCSFSSPKHPRCLIVDKKQRSQREMIFADMDRAVHTDQIIDKVVYDIFSATGNRESSARPTRQKSSAKRRESANGQEDDNCTLNFNSLFESGNLRQAIQIRKYEYDLLLNPDINTNHHHQWFYFAVSNTRACVKYRFNIINCLKINSQFNFGMQPVVYSVREAMEGSPGWKRSGEDICYYKNHYARPSAATAGKKGKNYYTTAFNLTFNHSNDIVYIAYHFPYTYTTLQVHLAKLEAGLCDLSDIYYRRHTLCESLGGNSLQLLTITANPMSLDQDGIDEFRSRPYVVLSARVHPGESNSSWVMKGVLRFLMSQHPAAELLRRTYIFKVVPMLNPDGVINGSHRCSLSGEDLNRQWINPNPVVHPTIYHYKGLLQYLQQKDRSPFVFCDFHGHSRKKNVFMYGNSYMMSYHPDDLAAAKDEDNSFLTLPRILNQIAPSFHFESCSFTVEKYKEGTARVVVWREIGVKRSYTMEATYCGLSQGRYDGYQITTQMLEEMGQNFCEALLRMWRPPQQPSASSVIYPYVMYDEEPDSAIEVPAEEMLDDQTPTPRSAAKAISAEDEDDQDDVEISEEENDNEPNVMIWLDEDPLLD
ncbi:cytosolic carboxypeptidase 1-like [Amphiura filiformis]|uniref:cytosolic carboxypeptidase 1-like n=1 Tax=Amphiura filiformis TaxID=82378 RepID=UPI003B212398